MTTRYNIKFKRTKWSTDVPKEVVIKDAVRYEIVHEASLFFWEEESVKEGTKPKITKTMKHWIPLKEIDDLDIEEVSTV